MKKDLEFKVDREDTLLPFLLFCLGGKSRNSIKGMLKRGQITVGGKPCTDYSRALSPGQMVGVLQRTAPPKKETGLSIIYEDNDIIVIDKPADMLAVATDNDRENTAFRAVNNYLKPRRAFIVHRLDRETSGVMLLAKSEESKQALQENWNDTVILRGYTAVVEGRVSDDEGRIESRLKQTKTLLVYSSENGGKPAITNYKTVKVSDDYSLLDISLETGRKNQIRVHMKDIGHPVAGDKKYGALTNPLERLGLHASALTIKHPFSGETMSFKVALPNAFNNAFKK